MGLKDFRNQLKESGQTIADATEVVRNSSTTLMVVAGAAIIISAIALVVAVTRK